MKTFLPLVSLLMGVSMTSAAPTSKVAAEKDVAPESAHSFNINAYSPPPADHKVNDALHRREEVTPEGANLFIIHSYGDRPSERKVENTLERRNEDNADGARLFNAIEAYTP
ncbi:hypothetical protein BDV32DRAFT_150353 [Aspergillus pseudonomiae]|uniref:Uncharacterized protein n=1 Tax=Aspergillus pseudonomiae TaxID=1506151 RepID=A0A5N7DD22_9EURO|nr:uncharacterized protein BDV37DRAFT_282915 [Aspergillus pseudonomiae]KAB8259472.1 hypothetical protein BDV32DRAFT_150353 [Aspergillus pseudonomiae]KAE8404366.1 hypothetical protein BDV37DRAFT_282915 [Aspergillus pseudonomiae]